MGVTGEAVKHWIRKRRLPATQLSNRYWQISKSDLEHFIQQHRIIGKTHYTVVTMDSDVLPVIRKAAAARECKLVLANNPADAILKLKDARAAIFLLDVASCADGWTLLKMLRSLPKLKSTPVVVLTDVPFTKERLQEALDLSVTGCLVKPVTVAQLEEEISAII
jgi:CheY-like chemotaxis protein